MIFNERLDAAVAAAFMLAVVIVLVASIAEWTAVLRGRRVAKSTEVPAEYGVAMAGD